MPRTCEVCGKEMYGGMTDDYGDLYVCEECFENYMDMRFGKGKWKSTEDPDEEDGCGGFYLTVDDEGKWEGTGIYYTEWEDDDILEE